MQDVNRGNVGRGNVGRGTGAYGNSIYFAQFFCKHLITLKNKVYLKNFCNLLDSEVQMREGTGGQ